MLVRGVGIAGFAVGDPPRRGGEVAADDLPAEVEAPGLPNVGRPHRQSRHRAPVEDRLVVVRRPRDDDRLASPDVGQGGVLCVDCAEGLGPFRQRGEVAAARQLGARIALRKGIRLEAVVPHRSLHVCITGDLPLIPAKDLGSGDHLVAEAVPSLPRHLVLLDEPRRLWVHGCIVGRPIAVGQDVRLVLKVKVVRELLPNREDALGQGLFGRELCVVYDHPHVVVRAAVVLSEDLHPLTAAVGQAVGHHGADPEWQRLWLDGGTEVIIVVWQGRLHDHEVSHLVEVVHTGQNARV
mmetsp:Transcript_99084/g.289063  ORF Transcript_99084/g.289063 Transcript_99084/m.289063 type:complete len:295 (+) Transcript_99084:317-1201(+)